MADLKTGSVREVWKVSYPMMISFFSMMFMIFIDRIFLSWYSTESFNAATTAGTLAWGFILAWTTLASMSEVFVAQYNGAKKHEMIGSPVWQTIWLTLLSVFFYIPVGYFLTPLIYDINTQSSEYHFFQILIYCGPVFAIIPAIGGFYIGRGKTSIMQWMAILGNLVNIVLDPLFIFGYKDLIPSMGIKGAAYATGIGSFVEAILLFWLFTRKKHRENFGTSNFSFDRSLFLQTLKVGLPPAIFVALEIIGWSLFYHFMSVISPLHIFVASVCQTILILFLFFGMGLEKGTIALAGNFIGAGQRNKITSVLTSGFKLASIFTLISSIFLIIFPGPMIDWFLQNPSMLDPAMSLNQINLAEAKFLIRIGLAFITFYIFLENLRWILNGILTAAGDTFFLLISGAISVWFLLLVPTYLFIVIPKANIAYSFVIWIVYSASASLIVFIRFLKGGWKEKSLVTESAKLELDAEESTESDSVTT
jgi:MATE family multidrug resistance protein